MLSERELRPDEEKNLSVLNGVIGTHNTKIKWLAEIAELIYFEVDEHGIGERQGVEYLWALTSAIHHHSSRIKYLSEKLDMAIIDLKKAARD